MTVIFRPVYLSFYATLIVLPLKEDAQHGACRVDAEFYDDDSD